MRASNSSSQPSSLRGGWGGGAGRRRIGKAPHGWKGWLQWWQGMKSLEGAAAGPSSQREAALKFHACTAGLALQTQLKLPGLCNPRGTRVGRVRTCTAGERPRRSLPRTVHPCTHTKRPARVECSTGAMQRAEVGGRTTACSAVRSDFSASCTFCCRQTHATGWHTGHTHVQTRAVGARGTAGTAPVVAPLVKAEAAGLVAQQAQQGVALPHPLPVDQQPGRAVADLICTRKQTLSCYLR